MAEQYIGAEILLLRRDQVAKGHVVAWSHDANGNVLVRVHTNPILILGCIKLSLVGGSY